MAKSPVLSKIEFVKMQVNLLSDLSKWSSYRAVNDVLAKLFIRLAVFEVLELYDIQFILGY